MPSKKFAIQVDTDLLAAVSEIAHKQGRQLQALVEEAFVDLVEKHCKVWPRPYAMDTYLANRYYLESLQDVDRWPFLDMICVVNRNNGKTAVLKHENGTYILIPGVHPNRPFEVPENARRGKRELLETLVNEGWKPD